MPNSINNQTLIFLWSVIGGMAIGFIYDIFRIKRKAIKTGVILTYLEDFIFWMLVALVMFSVVYYSNDGEIRGYNILGTILGVVLYALLLSKAVIMSSMFVINIVCKVFITIWRVVTYPFRIIYRILKIPGRFIAKKASLTCKKARRSGKVILSRASIWKRIFKNARKKI